MKILIEDKEGCVAKNSKQLEVKKIEPLELILTSDAKQELSI